MNSEHPPVPRDIIIITALPRYLHHLNGCIKTYKIVVNVNYNWKKIKYFNQKYASHNKHQFKIVTNRHCMQMQFAGEISKSELLQWEWLLRQISELLPSRAFLSFPPAAESFLKYPESSKCLKLVRTRPYMAHFPLTIITLLPSK